MTFSQINREILSNLKGRISKLLSGTRKVTMEEKVTSEKLLSTIDEIFLWDKSVSSTKCDRYRNALSYYKEELEKSDKKYIKNHILPMLSKILGQKW